jgi:hypothetical protein
MHATRDPRDKGGGLGLVNCRMPANGAGASTSVLCPTLPDSGNRQALPCQNLNETSHATIVQTGHRPSVQLPRLHPGKNDYLNFVPLPAKKLGIICRTCLCATMDMNQTGGGDVTGTSSCA